MSSMNPFRHGEKNVLVIECARCVEAALADITTVHADGTVLDTLSHPLGSCVTRSLTMCSSLSICQV